MLVPKMITLIRMDAAFRCLQEYDPDLDVRPLTAEWATLNAEDRAKLHAQTHLIRMMMVARIADIVKQTPEDEVALDAVVAMVEVLISTCEGRSEHPIHGQKQAMQAIQLLASVPSYLDIAIDLFFDLVERFCAQSRSRGLMQTNTTTTTLSSDAFSERMLQNYDQALLRLISKHRDPRATWNVTATIERIKDLRHLYEFLEGPKKSRFRKKDGNSSLFPDSYQLLRRARKQGVASITSSKRKIGCWATPKSSRSTTTSCSDTSSPASTFGWSGSNFSTTSRSLSNTTGSTSQIDLSELPRSDADLSSALPVEPAVELKTDLRVLQKINEESEPTSTVDLRSGIPTVSTFSYDMAGENAQPSRVVYAT